MTGAQWRKLACSLPEAEEKSHFGHPDFRVRNKIFASMSPDGKQGTLKLAPEFQSILIDSKPKVFSPAAGAWGVKGWTHVVLANLDAALAPELLRTAWSLVAPTTLRAAHSGKQPAAESERAKPSRHRRTSRARLNRQGAKGTPGGPPTE